MKTNLLPIVISLGTLLPFTMAQAVENPGKLYGGLAPGTTFTLKVTDASTSRTEGENIRKGVPIPNGIPEFKEGQRVKFTIGDAGQLEGAGFSVTYNTREERLNLYSNKPSWKSPNGEAATVSKTSTNKPKGASLTFYKFKFSGFIPVTTTVTYLLE